MDNLEEYQNPAEYDAENGEHQPSLTFFADLARQTGGPVLDLGCGTGRVAISLARLGYAVTGLDIVPGMLDLARQKSADLLKAAGLNGGTGSIRWVLGDCCRFDLGEQYPFIYMTGHAFQHLLDRKAQEAMLACVRAHLAPSGLFAFETRNPNLEHLLTNTAEEDWHTFTDPDGRPVRVSGYQTYDHVRQVQTWVTHRRRPGPDGQEELRTTQISLRYTFPQEMDTLLHYNGLTVTARYGNWDCSPVTAASPELIYVCRKTEE